MKRILAIALMLGLASPAVAEPYLPAGLAEKYINLRTIVMSQRRDCLELIRKSRNVDYIGCLDMANYDASQFNQATDQMCGYSSPWHSTAFCGSAATRIPYLYAPMGARRPKYDPNKYPAFYP